MFPSPPPVILKNNYGYSLAELMIVVAIIGILGSYASFNYSPANARLKSAARDLYSNMQQVRLGAIKTNSDWGMIFDNSTSEYFICSNYNDDLDCDDNNTFGDKNEKVEINIDLNDYKSGVQFGAITYNPNHVIFASNGRLKNVGYSGSVNLTNNKGTIYNISTTSLAGVIKITKP